MGIYDRDYFRNSPQRRFGSFSALSVTTWLIVINCIVFVLDGVLTQPAREIFVHGQPVGIIRGREPLVAWGAFTVRQGIAHLQLWRLISFQFLHANLPHIFGNMLGLYFFGQMVEEILGPRRYLVFYLACGMAGALSFTCMSGWGILGSSLDSQMIGASAGVFGVLIAAARLAPNTTVTLLFPPIPMKLKTLAWVMLAIAAYTVFTYGPSGRGNAGGEAAHLGGAMLGYILIRNYHWLNFVERLPKAWGQRRPRMYKGWNDDWNK